MQLLAFAGALALSGCAGQPPAMQGEAGTTIQVGMEKGIALLAAGQAKQANAEFNKALARAPSDANLHFLNGLSYREQYRDNGQAVSELAETGYRLALEFDSGHWLAAWHLGLQQIEQRQFAEARKSLAMAARLRPRNPDIQLALAGSAYLASDAPVALWAARNALALRPDDAEALRIAALSSAALGMESGAHEFLERFRQLRSSDAAILDDRIADWQRTYAQADVTDQSRSVTVTSKTEGTAVGSSVVAPQDPGPIFAPSGGAIIGAPYVQGPMAPAWSDCIQLANSQPVSSWGSGGSAGDTIERLPALPSPCKGMPLPRMAVVDATIIRTQDTTGYKQGINLLDGLKIVLGGSWERRTESSSSDLVVGGNTRSTSIARSLGLPQGGIVYSLNIFNVGDATADVIARPSLLALDRTPSVFFSGSTVSVALTGQYGGTMSDKNIGVSLSVTPTFIDDERLLLSVKGARSFIEPAQFQGFDQAVMSSNNTVSANAIMRFGETLILSGLREREYVKSKNGVPILRDVPLLQYMFSSHEDYDYAHHVMILITPRKPGTFPETDRAAAAYARTPEFQREQDDDIGTQALGALRSRRPNLEAILAKLQLSRYRIEFRSGDLSARRFAPQPSLERVLQDARQMIYY